MRSFALEEETASTTSVQRGRTTRYTRLLRIESSGSSRVSVAVSQTAENVSKIVVLKTIHRDRSRDRRATQRLLKEARLTARMNHPNVVQLHGVYREDALPVMVMEYLAGQPLANLLSTANDLPEFSIELRVALLIRLLTGLHYVHRLRDFDGTPLGLVHGGVSPGNVVITYDGQVKLIDFGRAELRISSGDTPSSMSRLPYLAPEQFGGKPDLRGDVFAAGAILWEMVAKRQLWGQVPAPVIVRRLLAGDVPRLRDAVPSVDLELDRICGIALAPQPDGRYRTAAEMKEDLERYVAQRGVAVSGLALGALVSSACRAQRLQARQLLDERLSELGLSLAQAESRSVLMPILARPVLDRRFRGFALLVLSGAFVVALLLWKAPGRQNTATTDPGPVKNPLDPIVLQAPPAEKVTAWGELPTESDVESPTRLIKLEVAVRPGHALLYLDGQRLSSNPLTAQVVWDPFSHTIRGQADGFEMFSRTFRLDSDLTIDVALERAPSSVGARRAPRSKAVAAQRASPARQSQLSARQRSGGTLDRKPLAEGTSPKVNILVD